MVIHHSPLLIKYLTFLVNFNNFFENTKKCFNWKGLVKTNLGKEQKDTYPIFLSSFDHLVFHRNSKTPPYYFSDPDPLLIPSTHCWRA